MIWLLLVGESLHSTWEQLKLIGQLFSGRIDPFSFAAQAQTLVDNQPPQNPWLSALVNYVVPFLSVVIFWKYRSATPGKIILGLSIVDSKTLQPPKAWQLIVRYLGYYVSLLAFGTGFFWIGVDERKQGFHDKMARTVVIREPKR